MGIRSNVVVAVKHSVINALSPETAEMLQNECDNAITTEEGKLFAFEDIKWYFGSDADLIKLYAELGNLPGEDYLIVCATSEYPDDTEGDCGSWWDNPWEVRKNVSVTVEYNK
jgi:hypothetical protein